MYKKIKTKTKEKDHAKFSVELESWDLLKKKSSLSLHKPRKNEDPISQWPISPAKDPSPTSSSTWTVSCSVILSNAFSISYASRSLIIITL